MGEFATLITGPSGTGRNWRPGDCANRGMCPSTIDVWRSRTMAAEFIPHQHLALSPTLVEKRTLRASSRAFSGGDCGS